MRLVVVLAVAEVRLVVVVSALLVVCVVFAEVFLSPDTVTVVR